MLLPWILSTELVIECVGCGHAGSCRDRVNVQVCLLFRFVGARFAAVSTKGIGKQLPILGVQILKPTG